MFVNDELRNLELRLIIEIVVIGFEILSGKWMVVFVEELSSLYLWA